MRLILLSGLMVFLLAADWAEPLRQGNTAYREGDFPKAELDFAEALEESPNPGLVAYNQALALARQGKYRAAELAFRASLSDATAPTARQAACHYNVGLCLLLRSSFEGGSLQLTAEATRAFEQALRLFNHDDPFHKDVKHNLEVAKLLWAEARTQALSRPDPQKATSKPENNEAYEPPSFNETEPTPQSGNSTPSSASPGSDVAGPQGMQPIETDQQSAGSGTLPVLDDSDEPQPLSESDARLHLERIATRLRTERNANAAVESERTFPQVRDW